MRTLRAAAAAAVLALATSASAAEIKKITSIEGITEYRLDNGLVVLLFPDDSRPKVTVNLTVFVGSRHEGYGETGMAHLLEHMVFKGTPTHPNVPKALQDRGAVFNGTTWVDRTNYYETLPAGDENLEFAIRLEADRMVNSFIKREDLLSEFSVVRNEFEMGENSPPNILSQRMMAVAYEWHNYGKSTIGNRTDIERVPIENLQAFYKRFYQPDNAMLVVAGKFDPEKALAYIQKYFGSIPRPKRKLDQTYTEEPAQDGERLVTLRRVGDVGVVGAIYHVPAGPHPEFAAVQILSQALTSAPSGRLYKALVESKKAASVNSSAYAWHDPGVLEIAAEVRKDQSLEEVQKTLLEVLEKELRQHPITQEEVDRARRQLLKARELAADNPTQIAIQLSDWAAQGDWRLYFLDRDRLEKITPAEVNAVVEKYLVRTNRTLGVFVPTEAPERTPIPAAGPIAEMVKDYKGRQAVAKGEEFDVSPANIESRVSRSSLPDGLKVSFLPKKNRGEAVQLRLALRYGDQESLKGYTSAAQFLPQLMLRGTKNLTRQQIQDELDRYRARLLAAGATGQLVFTLQTKRPDLPKVLEILRQVLREPTLPQDEFDVLKTKELADLEQQKTEPQALALRAMQSASSPYPKDDVRHVPSVEDEIERVKALTREKVQKLYDDFVSGRHGELTVVGDFDPAEVMPVLASIFGDWKAPQAYARIERPMHPGIEPGRKAIHTPDKANAIYVASQILPIRDDHPDFPALLMGNFILGGGTLSSRLGDRLRQKDGLSYGVGSFLNADAKDERAGLVLYAIANPSNLPKVEAGMREELQRLLKEGVTEDELAKAKQGYLQQQKVGRTNDGTLAALLAECQEVDRTMNYYAELEKKIEALTPGEVSEALRKHLDPKRLVIVVAGDFKSGKKDAAKAKSPAKDEGD